MAKPFEALVTVGTTGNTKPNLWLPLVSKSDPAAIIKVDPTLVKRLIVQARGTVNGNLFLSALADYTRTGSDNTGIQLAVPAPAAGPTYPSTFIDEPPCQIDQPNGWWFNADTNGLVFYVCVYI